MAETSHLSSPSRHPPRAAVFLKEASAEERARTLHQLSITDEKMLLLIGKIGKAYLVLFFVYLSDEIPDWEPGTKTKLGMLITFFRSGGS